MFPLSRFRVADASMQPTLRSGDYVVVNTWAYRSRAPRAGDIVVLRHPRQPALCIVKRVAGTPSKDEVFVVGDNADESEDSRAFGTVRRKLIVGKVWLRLKS